MRISRQDMLCRYLAAPGLKLDSPSPFGRQLSEQGLKIPDDCSLDWMVQSGWVAPVLRIKLPQNAIESWTNFPNCPRRGSNPSPSEEWAERLWINTVTSSPTPPSLEDESWWQHFLDDPEEPLTARVYKHAVDPGASDALPGTFTHTGSKQDVPLWIDFFAYWQMYQISELIQAATHTLRTTPGFEERLLNGATWLESVTESRMRSIKVRWSKHRSTFEWLSNLMKSWTVYVSCDKQTPATHGRLGPVAVSIEDHV
jgi:hypothetical protein